MIKDINTLHTILSDYTINYTISDSLSDESNKNKFELFDSSRYKTTLKGFYTHICESVRDTIIIVDFKKIEISSDLYKLLNRTITHNSYFNINHITNIIVNQRKNKLNKI